MSPRERRFCAELLRTQYVWNNFVSSLCSGLNPERIPGDLNRGRFNGSAEDRIMAIFKVMDHEVRHIGDTIRALGYEPPLVPFESEKIYDEVARAAELI